MSKVACTIRIYSFYLFLMGAGMMAIPNMILPLLGFSPSQEIWIRMLGLFTFTAGIYYFYSSLHEQTAFFKATIIGRILFFASTVIITFVFQAPFALIAIGSIDLLGALWTLAALKKV